MAKTIVCKKCGAELPAGATVCPACGRKRKKPFYKRGLFWFFVVAATVMAGVGSGVNSMEGGKPSSSSAPTSLLAKEMDLSQEQERVVLDIFAQCGIGEIDSVEVFHEGEEQTSYYVEDSETKAYRGADYAIVVWLDNETKEVQAIYFHDQDIYVDGAAQAKVSDFYVNAEDRSKYRVTAQMLVNELLLVPDSAKYPAKSGWAFGVEDGIVVVQSTVTSQNAYGVALENKFQIKFKNGNPISLIIDGKEYIK